MPGSEEYTDLLADKASIKKGTGTILLVDDEEFIRITAKSMLESMGYEVLLAENGKEGVDLFEKEYKNIDLVILDMIMDPGIDGLETYRRIHAMLPSQKTIIASGFSENERVMKAQELGAGVYIRKPYSLEMLGTAIRSALQAERMQS